MKLSHQQQAVLDWAANESGSLNIVARAGCGKTFTLLCLVDDIMRRAKESYSRTSILVAAYSSSISAEIAAKLKQSGVEDWRKDESGRWIAPLATAKTLHSLGWTAWRKAYVSCVIDKYKVEKILRKFGEDTGKADEIEPMFDFIVKSIDYAKQSAFGVLCSVEDHSKWHEIIDHFGVGDDLPMAFDMKKAIDIAIQIYRMSADQCYTVIDFNDMILAPLYHNLKMFTYDWVLVDEAQDLNASRRALAKKVMNPYRGRLVAVGDPCQAIFGFTGADSDSMNILKAELGSIELPLNVTYRCPKQVVQLAQTWVFDFAAADEAPLGVIRNIHEFELMAEKFTNEDVILCRNTKPLVELAYGLIRRGIGCAVEGKSIGVGLVKIIKHWKTNKISVLLDALSKWQENEVSKWITAGKEQKADSVDDQCETIRTIAEKLQADSTHDVDSLVRFIESIFDNTKPEDGPPKKILTLSTIHKSKGREWERVYLLGRNRYQPSHYARKDWQVDQEVNLMYVAVTRAKHELVEVFVEIPKPK